MIQLNFSPKTLALRAFVPLLMLVGQIAWGQCNFSSSYGSATINTSGTVVTISTCSFAGEYSTISGAVSGQTLKFTSSGATDYITIRSGSSSGPVLAYGISPLTYSNTFTGTLYAHWSSDASCGTQNSCRTTTVQCTSCSGGGGGCNNTSSYGSATISTSGAVVTISTCSFAGEYSTISGAVAGQTLKFTSSVATDYITVRSGTSGGTVLASGLTPLTFANTYTGTIYAHWNSDASCGSQSSCRTTTVQCTSCVPPPPPANDLCTGAINITCGQTITGTTAAATVDASAPTCVTTLNTAPGVWYQFIGDGQTATLSLCGSSYDTKIGAFTGSCSSLVCVSGSDDFCGNASEITFPTTVGTTYYVLVTGFSSSSGAFTLTRTCTCTQPSVPVISASANPSCFNGPTTLSLTGTLGSATQWAWYSGSCGGTFLGNGTSIVVNPTTTTTYFARGEGGCVSGATCGSITVTIETTVPTFTSCPGNQVFGNTTGLCSAVVSWPAPAATDNCGTPTIVQTAGPTSGSTQPVGTNATVSYKATDSAGNTAVCSFTVQVNDTQIPTIVCPPNTSVSVNSSCQGTLGAYTGTVSDNCSGATQTLQTPAAGSLITGNTTVTLRATDAAANTGTCTFLVTVNDITPPAITCPGTQTQFVNTSCQASVANYTTLATATDNCSLPLGAVTQTPLAGAIVSTGTTPVTLKVTDGAGLMATCTFNLSVLDNILPAITCPANIVVSNTANLCSAVVTYTTPATSDNCGISSVTLLSGLGSGASYPVGTTTNTWRATDLSANTRTCSFTVTVNDTQAPTITCPANIVKSNDLGQCGALTSYPTPAASDNCSTATVTFVSGLTSGSFFPVGTTTNVWKVTDASMNTATCSFTVKVNDTEAPKITCPVDIVKGNNIGDCSASIPYLGSPQISDNCLVQGVTNNSPGTFPIGTVDVTWIITDNHGNTAACVQHVSVQDREYPVLICPSNIVAQTNESDCVATVDYSATATDNCAGLSVEYSVESGSSFDVGLSNVQVTATDASGNFTNCTFQITVKTRAEICNGADDDCDGWVDEAEDWTSVAKRLAADGGAQDEYGVSVDVDGDYAIVGSNQKNGSGQSVGAAYILARNQGGQGEWGQLVKLTAPGLLPGDNFGASVSISGGIAAVGAPLDDDQFGNQGAVYIFYQNPGSLSQWDFVKKVTATDAASASNFGNSIALENDHLLVGANTDSEQGANAGAAYMFYQNTGGANNWGEVAKLLPTAGNADDNFGASVALNGNYALVGAPGVDNVSQNTGAAYVFGRNQFGADNWGQVSKLFATQAGSNSNFGASVAVSGNWAIVGADKNDIKGLDAGAAFVFNKNQNGINNSWGLHNIILDNAGQAGDRFGSAVGVDAPYAVITARGDNPFGTHSGRGFVYLLDEDNWVLVEQIADGSGQAEDGLGSCAAIDGRTIILGEQFDNTGTNGDQGAVLIYEGLCAQNRPTPRTDGSIEVEPVVHAFPVPFSDVLNIEITGVNSPAANISIVNTLGQEVSSVYTGAIEGEMVFHWRPGKLASGLYFLRIAAGNKVITQPVTLQR